MQNRPSKFSSLLLCGLLTAMIAGCGRAPASTSPAYTSKGQLAAKSKTYDAIIDEFVIGSFEKQLSLVDVHGKDSWKFDMDRGEIMFNDSVAYKVQILGTESESSNTWRWAWANAASEIPDKLLVAAKDLQEFGKKHKIAELTESDHPLDKVDGHILSLIAVGMCDAQAYYRCKTDKGHLFVLITDVKLPKTDTEPVLRMITTITDAISKFEISNHKEAITSFLKQKKIEPKFAGNELTASVGTKSLQIKFDDQNRMTSISSK